MPHIRRVSPRRPPKSRPTRACIRRHIHERSDSNLIRAFGLGGLALKTMTQELIERSRQRLAFAGLPVILITLSLAMSIVIAATAVSIGIARADTLMPAASSGRLMFVL